MRIFDLNLRETNPTLIKLLSIDDFFNFRDMIIYLQASAKSNDEEIPEKISFNDTSAFSSNKLSELANWAVRNGFCIPDHGMYCFTEKTFKIFQKLISKSSISKILVNF